VLIFGVSIQTEHAAGATNDAFGVHRYIAPPRLKCRILGTYSVICPTKVGLEVVPLGSSFVVVSVSSCWLYVLDMHVPVPLPLLIPEVHYYGGKDLTHFQRPDEFWSKLSVKGVALI